MRPLRVDLDGILEDAGGVGKYQIKYFLWTIIPVVLGSLHVSSYLFTADDTLYRCYVPECDGNDKVFDPSWLSNAIPREAKCSRYISTPTTEPETTIDSSTPPPTTTDYPTPPPTTTDYPTSSPATTDYTTLSSTTIDYYPTLPMRNDSRRRDISEEACAANLFDTDIEIDCRQYMYKDDNTFIQEMNMPCQDWKRSLLGSVQSIGSMIALPISGMFSDRFGRRHCLIVSSILGGIFGIGKSLATNYIMFLSLEFLGALGVAGVYISAYTLATDLLTPSKRVLGDAVISTYFSIGQILLGFAAWGFPYWRTYLQVLHTPCIIILTFYWIADESIRWLLSKRRYQDTINGLKKIAAVNGTSLTDKSLKSLQYNLNISEKFEYSHSYRTEDLEDRQRRADKAAVKDRQRRADKADIEVTQRKADIEDRQRRAGEVDEEVNEKNVPWRRVIRYIKRQCNHDDTEHFEEVNSDSVDVENMQRMVHGKDGADEKNVEKNILRSINRQCNLDNTEHFEDGNSDRLRRTNQEINGKNVPNWRLVLRSREVVLIVLKASVWWITCMFCVQGLSIMSTVLPGTSYLNFIYTSFVEIPSQIMSYYGLKHYGSKKTLFVSFLGAGLSLLCVAHIPKGLDTFSLVIFLFGKFFAVVAMNSIYPYTSELFPTPLRHSLLTTCFMIGRIGSILAPQTLLLVKYKEQLPLFLFASTCLISAALMLRLDPKIPEEVEEKIIMKPRFTI